MASALSHRPTYTDDQLSTYLSFVFHSSHPLHDLKTFREKLAADPLATLATLQKHHLGKIPWGDVGLHYSTTKLLSLEAQALFDKIVVDKLGGYCMEVNSFYAIVLRSLGVKLYTTGGRMSNEIDAPGKRDPLGFAGW
jgi:arylamine N-acetyltransferase